MIVVFEQSYAGCRDDSETIPRIECGETDDEAIEERLILIFKRYLISNIDFLLSILLLDNLYHFLRSIRFAFQFCYNFYSITKSVYALKAIISKNIDHVPKDNSI